MGMLKIFPNSFQALATRFYLVACSKEEKSSRSASDGISSRESRHQGDRGAPLAGFALALSRGRPGTEQGRQRASSASRGERNGSESGAAIGHAAVGFYCGCVWIHSRPFASESMGSRSSGRMRRKITSPPSGMKLMASDYADPRGCTAMIRSHISLIFTASTPRSGRFRVSCITSIRRIELSDAELLLIDRVTLKIPGSRPLCAEISGALPSDSVF